MDTEEPQLLTRKQLAEALGLTERAVMILARKRKIPEVVLGYRTRRYIKADCLAALVKLTRKAL